MLRQLRRLNAHQLAALSRVSAVNADIVATCGDSAAAVCSGQAPCLAAAAAAWAPAAAWQLQQVASYAKAHKGKKGGGGEAEANAGAAGASFDLSETKSLMERAVAHLQGELANLRTGRATPGMLDHLKVDVYGDRLPLKACGSVSVRDPQLLAITVFDADAVPSVVKAVADSPLRLSPRAEGQEVLVPIPRPTTEMLSNMMKVCKAEGEDAKVSVRHARQAAMQAAKKLASEDERKRVEKEVQKLTDEFVKEVEALVAAKEKSIRSHDS